MSTPLGIRWTIGDASERNFEALRLSVHGAVRVFGTECAYAVYWERWRSELYSRVGLAPAS